jgi:hypothetical protein
LESDRPAYITNLYATQKLLEHKNPKVFTTLIAVSARTTSLKALELTVEDSNQFINENLNYQLYTKGTNTQHRHMQNRSIYTNFLTTKQLI